MFIITFFGCIGAVRENTTLLKVYSIILLIITLLIIAAAVLAFVYRVQVEEKITTKLKKLIPLYNGGEEYLDIQNLVDEVQTGLSCCGAKDYNDWDANMYFNCSQPVLIPSRYVLWVINILL